MLEAICLERARWQRELGGGSLTLLWVPSHAGIVPNGNADLLAKAYISEKPRDLRTIRRASLVRYETNTQPRRVGKLQPAPIWSWQAAGHGLRGLMQRGLHGHVLHQMLDEPKGSASSASRRARLLLDTPDDNGLRSKSCGLEGELAVSHQTYWHV